MTGTDDTALAVLAADFPDWHMWRSRDSSGRDRDWNATRRRRAGRGAVSAGVLGRLTAGSAAGLRGMLEQQRAVQPATEQVA
jgi:hypothetical protein